MKRILVFGGCMFLAGCMTICGIIAMTIGNFRQAIGLFAAGLVSANFWRIL